MTSSPFGCTDLKLNACKVASCKATGALFCAYVESGLLPCDAQYEILSEITLKKQKVFGESPFSCIKSHGIRLPTARSAPLLKRQPREVSSKNSI